MSKKKSVKIFLFFFLVTNLLFNPIVLAQDAWVPLDHGGGIYNGKVNALAVDSEETLYAATWDGIYRSIDGAKSWVYIGYKNLNIWDILVTDKNEIFAAMDNAIFYSSNKGDSWTNRNIPSSKGAQALTMSPDGRIFAATINGPFVFNPTDSIWQAYSASDAIIREYGTRRVAVDSEGTIYSATGLDQEIGGLYRSDDSGNTWQDVTPPSGTSIVRAINVESKGRLWAGTGNGLYFSDDKGNSWEIVSALRPSNMISIEFAPDGSVYASTSDRRLFGSDNKGEGWKLVANQYVFDIAFLADGNIFLATKKGVSYSEDNGLSWIEENFPMNNSFVYDVAFDADGRLYAASSVGLYSSTDEGYSFSLELIDFGGKDIDAHTILITENDDVFVSTHSNDIFSKTEGNDNWQNASVPGTIMNITKHPSGVLFAGTWGNGVFRSDDRGQSWQESTLPSNLYVRSQLATENGDLFVGAKDNDGNFIGYYFSSDAGKTWTRKVFEGYYGHGQLIIAMLQNFNNDLIFSTGMGIYRSACNGDNWDGVFERVFSAPSSNHSLVSVECFAKAPDDQIFAGTVRDGILQSDEGSTWRFIPSIGLYNKRVVSITISQSGHLFASTISSDGSGYNGILRSEEKIITTSVTTKPENLPPHFTLEQNYPNPFNPGTSISYSLFKVAHVDLTVFDHLGRTVQVLVNESKPAGTHKVYFNGDGLATGIYYYRLHVDNYSQTRKFFLLK